MRGFVFGALLGLVVASPQLTLGPADGTFTIRGDGTLQEPVSTQIATYDSDTGTLTIGPDSHDIMICVQHYAEPMHEECVRAGDLEEPMPDDEEYLEGID